MSYEFLSYLFFFNSVTYGSGSNSLFWKLLKLFNNNILYSASSTCANISNEEEIYA